MSLGVSMENKECYNAMSSYFLVRALLQPLKIFGCFYEHKLIDVVPILAEYIFEFLVFSLKYNIKKIVPS